MSNAAIREVALAVSRNGRPLGQALDRHIRVHPVSGEPHIPAEAVGALDRESLRALMECLVDAPARTLLACSRLLSRPATRQRLFEELAEIAAMNSVIAIAHLANADPAGHA